MESRNFLIQIFFELGRNLIAGLFEKILNRKIATVHTSPKIPKTWN